MANPDGNPNMRKGAPSVNPSGRPAKTDAERAGEMYLRERTEEAAERLCQLQKSSDEKIALGATIAHLKITLGTLERKAGANGEDPVDPLEGWTAEKLAAFGEWCLERKLVATQLHVEESPKT